MSASPPPSVPATHEPFGPVRRRTVDMVSLAARLIVGGLFVSMGLSKVADPVDFLKLVREYDLVEDPLMLNLIATTLPWFEVFCGVLLLAGVAVRGTAVLSLGMLVPFSLVVWSRAQDLHTAAGGAFCGIRFDCGCGAGEVAVCHKLAENFVLMILSGWLLIARHRRWCLAPEMLRAPTWTASPGERAS